MPSLIRNERTKLLANALDRTSTACIAAGLIGPFVASMNGVGPLHMSWAAILSCAVWISAAIVLHIGARHVLGGLES